MSWHRPNAPSGPITSGFGKRGPIPGAPNASTYHLGVDLRAGTLSVTSDIYAATAGTVRRIYQTPLGAWVLELDHGKGVRTRYAHMQRAGIAVKVGAKVAGGQRIAAASNSGAPTVHLHFEVLIDGTQIDPVPYMKARGVDLTATTVAKPGGGTGSITVPTIPGAPAPITPEDDMSEAAEKKIDAIYAAIFNGGTSMPGGQPLKDRIESQFAKTNAAIERLPAAIWGTSVARGSKKVAALQEVADAKTAALSYAGQIAALTAAVNVLAKGQGVDPAMIEAAARRGVAGALTSIQTTVTVKGTPA